METKNLVMVIVIVIVAVGLLVWGNRPAPANAALDQFTQCLASKNITMYGADWCPHCQNEKKAFGGSFKYVPYVECPDNPQKCIAVGIETYPTWILPNNTKLVGEQGVEKLAEASGCPLSE